MEDSSCIKALYISLCLLFSYLKRLAADVSLCWWCDMVACTCIDATCYCNYDASQQPLIWVKLIGRQTADRALVLCTLICKNWGWHCAMRWVKSSIFGRFKAWYCRIWYRNSLVCWFWCCRSNSSHLGLRTYFMFWMKSLVHQNRVYCDLCCSTRTVGVWGSVAKWEQCTCGFVLQHKNCGCLGFCCWMRTMHMWVCVAERPFPDVADVVAEGPGNTVSEWGWGWPGWLWGQ